MPVVSARTDHEPSSEKSMKDPEKIKDLIFKKVDLADVMLDYGVRFVFHPSHADEVQYRCPFHGKDNKPSARFYRQTQSCYCWYCRKSWDVIGFVREKESLGFIPALMYIANKYHVDLSSIPDDPEFKGEKKVELSDTAIRISIIHKNLLRIKRKINFKKYNVMCAYFLSISFKAFKKEDIKKSLLKLEEKISQCLS